MHQSFKRIQSRISAPNKCEECRGIGSVVVDHVAWLSGGDFYEKDVWDCCPECDGTGQPKQENTNEQQ